MQFDWLARAIFDGFDKHVDMIAPGHNKLINFVATKRNV